MYILMERKKEAIDLIQQYNNAKLGYKLEFNTNQKTMYINGTSKIVYKKAEDSVNL